MASRQETQTPEKHDHELSREEYNHFLRRLKTLEDERKNGWESHWRALAKNFLPRRSRFLDAGDRTNDGAVMNLLQSGVGILCLRVLANGMQSGLTSPARPWFSLDLTNKHLADWQYANASSGRAGTMLGMGGTLLGGIGQGMGRYNSWAGTQPKPGAGKKTGISKNSGF